MTAILEIIKVIDTAVANSKIIRWAVIGGLAAAIIFAGYLSVRNHFLKFNNAMLKSTVGDFGAAIEVQNREVARLGEATQIARKNYELHIKEASEIALRSVKKVEAILDYSFEGECSQKLNTAVKMIKDGLGDKK